MAHSPKVATYDLQPEMSAHEIVASIVPELEAGRPDFVCLNFANPDMVGHTGVLSAAIAAVESVDKCLGDIARVVEARGGALVVTADHGNDPTWVGTDHTRERVPVLIAGDTMEDIGLLGFTDVANLVARHLGVTPLC